MLSNCVARIARGRPQTAHVLPLDRGWRGEIVVQGLCTALHPTWVTQRPGTKPTTNETTPNDQCIGKYRNETRVKMNPKRTRIADRLKESQDTAAFLTAFQEIDMSNLVGMRSEHKGSIFPAHDELGFMPAFALAVCLAFKDIPEANASIEGNEVAYRDYVDLQVTVATQRALSAVGREALDDQLALEDLTGGTFTISNGGVPDSLFGTSVLNMPQTSMLALHSIKEKTMVVNGSIVIRPVMIVAFTYDHRLLDGREGTTFLVRVKQYIEDPRKILIA